MRSTLLFAAALTGLVATAPGVAAAASAELNDLAARVHYGYYHAEPRVVAAALVALDRLPDGVEVTYQRDFAALRAAQLGGAGQDVERRVAACARRSVDGKLPARAAAEAWVLAAACAFVAGDGRRLNEALATARRLDSDHPRLALVEAWAFERDVATRDDQREAVAARWATVVAAFEAFAPSLEDPGWGHAEALVALASSVLARGEVRAARDLVERALLHAPDYRAALELRARLQSRPSGNPAP